MAYRRDRCQYTLQYKPHIDFPVLVRNESGPLYVDFRADKASGLASAEEHFMNELLADDLSVSGLVEDDPPELPGSPCRSHVGYEDPAEASDANAEVGTSAGSRSQALSCQSDKGSLPSLGGSSDYSDLNAEDTTLQSANVSLQQQVRMLTAELVIARAELAKSRQSLETCAQNSRNSRKELYKSKAATRKAEREARDLQEDLELQCQRTDVAVERAKGAEMELKTEKMLRCSRVSIIQSTKATIKKQESQILDRDRQLKLKDCVIRKLRLREKGTEKCTGTLREKVEEQQAVALRLKATLEDAEESSFDLLNLLDDQEECVADLDLKIGLLSVDGDKHPMMHAHGDVFFT